MDTVPHSWGQCDQQFFFLRAWTNGIKIVLKIDVQECDLPGSISAFKYDTHRSFGNSYLSESLL